MSVGGQRRRCRRRSSATLLTDEFEFAVSLCSTHEVGERAAPLAESGGTLLVGASNAKIRQIMLDWRSDKESSGSEKLQNARRHSIACLQTFKLRRDLSTTNRIARTQPTGWPRNLPKRYANQSFTQSAQKRHRDSRSAMLALPS